jgi:hypothetical protein
MNWRVYQRGLGAPLERMPAGTEHYALPGMPPGHWRRWGRLAVLVLVSAAMGAAFAIFMTKGL